MTADTKLTGKVAVVVGGSRRAGALAACDLAEDGAHVVVTARRARDEIDTVVNRIVEAGGSAESLLMDVTQEASVRSAVEHIERQRGRLDILVNNAAIRKTSPFLETTLDDWREIMVVNLDGVFLTCREALPLMLAGGGGTIVNVGGVTAHIGVRNRAHVAAAKAGIVGLTKALAIEFAEHGVTVNCVVPGKIGGKRAATAGESPIGEVRIPLGREGEAHEVAAVIRFLCSAGASFMTGQTVHVSGGLYLP